MITYLVLGDSYRIFDSDPVLWHHNFSMAWRNGEVSPVGYPGQKCVEGDPVCYLQSSRLESMQFIVQPTNSFVAD